jgi:MFS family permease
VTAPTAVPSDSSIGARQYGFLAFMTLLNVMNFVDRQLLASFAAFIVPDLGLTNTEFGLLTGFAFIVFYSLMGLVAGAIADMVHRPRLVAGALTLWSLLTAASGRATGFVSLLIPRMFIGVGESVLTPASMSMLSDRFPASRMGFASGFYYMGVPIGAGLSLLIVGYLGPTIGWRNCFYALGAVGVGLAACMLFVRETRTEVAGADAEPAARSAGIGEIIRALRDALTSSPALVATIAGGVAFHFILGAAAFDQLWFVQERGFDRAEIARMTGWIGMAAGIAGNLFGGWGGDQWQQRTGTGRPLFLFWIGLVFTPIGVMYRLVEGGTLLFWIGVGAGFFQLGTFYGPTFATVQELVSPKIRASMVAFYLLMLNFVGLGVGITFGGILVDALAERGVSEPYTKTLLVFTFLSASAIPCFWFAGRRYQADKARLDAA